MTTKTFPFTLEQTEALAKIHPTPFHLYDEEAIRENARRITAAFSILPAFREYFAVKAAPNPFLLKILASEGFGADCSSMAELKLCEKIGLHGERIMFTSNETPDAEFIEARRLGAILNLDDITHMDAVVAATGSLPDTLCFRYNPGPLKEGNAIIGKPEEAKYGLTRDQIFEAYARAWDAGVKRFGLHTMVVSNELNEQYHIETVRMLFELAVEIKKNTGVGVSFINTGGGVGIPYRPEEKAVDYAVIANAVRQAYDELLAPAGLGNAAFNVEWGRCITGPYGWLVTRAIRQKNTYRSYIGVDASMANLMRPGMYGAYHHLTVLGKESAPADHTYDVVGSLCENCDKFAIERHLPEIHPGDLIVLHDTGAHGHAMGFNYNGKPRSTELLRRTDGSILQIRKPETLDHLFSTLDFPALASFQA
ncbi:MAG: diaminopimelate decarboxylase [Verrucomicrobiota bacterium]|jgi:diaminopimelate decarboxylase|nr:diaminopimelate decarboxylase [Verrucomicrobiota bacterium]